jgi:DNA-binding response OmpR family regulator
MSKGEDTMVNILLTEDDEAVAMGIEFTLKDEGFNVVRKATVKDSIEEFDKGKFQLILLDINLPDGSGYEVCKYIREKSEIPIIFLTACDEEVNVVLGLDIGGDDYITKPFRLRELISRIKAILRRSAKKELSNELKSGDIILNTSTAEIYKKGKKTTLTSQEYKLILVFMNNPHVLMNKDDILNEIMEGEGAYADTNTLAVYIKRIREKIEENSSEPKYIVTQRGLGYKWNMDVSKE